RYPDVSASPAVLFALRKKARRCLGRSGSGEREALHPATASDRRGERSDKVLVDLEVVDRKRCRYRGWNVRLVDQDALGDFQDKVGWCDAASRQCRANHVDDSAVAHLQRRHREIVSIKPICPATGMNDAAAAQSRHVRLTPLSTQCGREIDSITVWMIVST